MGLSVILRTDRGEQVRGLDDPNGGTFDAAGDFDRLLPDDTNVSYRLIRSVDPYGRRPSTGTRWLTCSSTSSGSSTWRRTTASDEG